MLKQKENPTLMNLTAETPPNIAKLKMRQKRSNRSYDSLLASVRQHASNWVSLPLEEIDGDLLNRKQATILRAAKWRQMLLQSTVQNGKLYVRQIG